MYFPLICTWIVNAGSTVGKDSGAMFNLETMFEVSVDEDWVCFSVGAVGIGVGDGLIRENVADRIYILKKCGEDIHIRYCESQHILLLTYKSRKCVACGDDMVCWNSDTSVFLDPVLLRRSMASLSSTSSGS